MELLSFFIGQRGKSLCFLNNLEIVQIIEKRNWKTFRLRQQFLINLNDVTQKKIFCFADKIV